MFKRILVPLDGSELAEFVLPHLAGLVKAWEAEVCLLRVLDADGGRDSSQPVDPFDWHLLKAEAETYLRDVARRLEKIGIRPQVDVRAGRAAETILEVTREWVADLILLSSHGQSGLSGWNVSGVVQKIILRSPTSVMIVRAYQPGVKDQDELHYERILAPLDGSTRAEVVLPVASTLARAHDSQVVLVHVVEKPAMPRRTPASQEDLQLADQITERNRVEAAAYLAEVQSRLDASSITRLLIDDHVASTLHRMAEQERVDLVILSAHGSSGETRWPYGGLVISFLAYGTTPLLVVQDLPPERIEPTRAELAARQLGKR